MAVSREMNPLPLRPAFADCYIRHVNRANYPALAVDKAESFRLSDKRSGLGGEPGQAVLRAKRRAPGRRRPRHAPTALSRSPRTQGTRPRFPRSRNSTYQLLPLTLLSRQTIITR